MVQYKKKIDQASAFAQKEDRKWKYQQTNNDDNITKRKMKKKREAKIAK